MNSAPNRLPIGTLVRPTNTGYDHKTGKDIHWNRCRGKVASTPWECTPGMWVVEVKWIGRSALELGAKSCYEVKKLEPVTT
jgi:hypothetical protein